MEKRDTILIVDDEPANVYLLQLMLEEKYELITSDNGKDAVKQAEEKLPDLILLDIMMPRMDGLEVCKVLIGNEITKDIPIILVSAKIQDKDVEAGLDMGAIDYIKKPVSEIELKARVRTALRIKHREDELKRLNRLKDNFLQIVSHDLLSPFTGVVNSSSLLLAKDLGNPLNKIQRELLEVIKGSAEKQLRYVKDLLTLALEESNRFVLKKEEVSLKKLVDEAMEINRLAAQNKNIDMVNTIDEKVLINVDQDKFSQILNNLIRNAVKFTYGNGKVEASFRHENNRYFISIKDNGTGMNEKKIQELLGEGKVFSIKGTDDEAGTGLGIKICKSIIEAHKGELLIQSEPGKGSTFTISLPADEN